eukprot:843752_1
MVVNRWISIILFVLIMYAISCGLYQNWIVHIVGVEMQNEESYVPNDKIHNNDKILIIPSFHHKLERNTGLVIGVVTQSDDDDISHYVPSVPTLWIMSPSKSATTSTVTTLVNIYPNWDSPTQSNEFNECAHLWSSFILEKYFSTSCTVRSCITLPEQQQNYDGFLTSLDSWSKDLQNITQYPFKRLLLSLDDRMEYVIHDQIIDAQKQYFTYGIKQGTEDIHHVSVIKTPQHFYSPFVPIIFAHYHPATKVLITIRNPVKRIISWYSMVFVRATNGSVPDALERYPLLGSTMAFDMLRTMKHLILNRRNTMNDVEIINSYFRFWLRFYILYEKCIATHIDTHRLEFQRNAGECDVIGHGTRLTRFVYKTVWRHPIHMLFSGLLYPHLLLRLVVYEQQHLLGTQLKLMSFSYFVTNSNEALAQIKCWAEGEYRCDASYSGGNSSYLNHVNHRAVAFPSEVVDELYAYFDPVIEKVNELLYQYNQTHDIFLGSWNYAF